MSAPQIFTVGSAPILYQRLSPSGPIINNGQASAFSQNDNITSTSTGRAWLYQGFVSGGGAVQVPGTAAGDLDGLGAGACPVVMQNVAGYQYDVRLDMAAYGTLGGFKAFILGHYTTDPAGTYAVVLAQNEAFISIASVYGSSSILRSIVDSSNLSHPIDNIKVQLANFSAASSAQTYYPRECVVSVNEYLAP